MRQHCPKILCHCLSMRQHCPKILCHCLSMLQHCPKILCHCLSMWQHCSKILYHCLSMLQHCLALLLPYRWSHLYLREEEKTHTYSLQMWKRFLYPSTAHSCIPDDCTTLMSYKYLLQVRPSAMKAQDLILYVALYIGTILTAQKG